jgi:hypothetical protein
MRWLTLLVLAWLGAAAAPAQTDYTSHLTEGDVMLRDFRFGSGETCPSCASTMRRSARPGAMPPDASSMR